MKLLRPSRALREIAGRLTPAHWGSLLARAQRKRNGAKAADDAQLALYAQILPGGFLNYGYSDDPGIPPEQLSLAMVQQAQVRYAERLLEQVPGNACDILDAGCGMGGLVGLMVRRGLRPTALTPNRIQARHVREVYPQVPVQEVRLEDLPDSQSSGRFDVIVTSESFQYMRLEDSLRVFQRVLRPGGYWILADYFRHLAATDRRSGHIWTDFMAAIAHQGWRIRHSEDITAHTLPTMGWIHMWGQRVGMPVEQYLVSRLERKRPVLHYLLQDVLSGVRSRLMDEMSVVDPVVFAREKKYMLLVLERDGAAPQA